MLSDASNSSEASQTGATGLAEVVWGLCLGLVPSILLAAEEIKQTMFLFVNISQSRRNIHDKTIDYAIYIVCYQEDSSLSARAEHYS